MALLTTVPGNSDASRDDARVVSDVSVLCPRHGACHDNACGGGSAVEREALGSAGAVDGADRLQT
jgi:hypothetical protein